MSKESNIEYWNHRVIKKLIDGSPIYEIHEVYYDKKNKIISWTDTAVQPLGETREELKADIEYFIQAFRRPTLNLINKGGKDLLKEDKYDETINTGHYFEIMDRVSVAADYFQTFLASHPVIKKEKELEDVVEKITGLLGELYQLSGALYFSKEE